MQLEQILISDFTTSSGKTYTIPITYQCFGPALHAAPVILVLHALTGNSNVAGPDGWWHKLVAHGSAVDLDKYTVIAFNIPGNGYDGFFVEDYQDFNISDIAQLFILALRILNVDHLWVIIGGSLGGAIGWEILSQQPQYASFFIPIATHFKTSDWLYTQCVVQEFLLESPEDGMYKARYHAMLCYRTPNSINQRFKNQILENGKRKSEDWLDYHGNALGLRFEKRSYQLMNHLLKSINVNKEKLLKIESEIHLIAVNTDLYFTSEEMKATWDLNFKEAKLHYHEIISEHGHDAFLIEYEQLNNIISNILS